MHRTSATVWWDCRQKSIVLRLLQHRPCNIASQRSVQILCGGRLTCDGRRYTGMQQSHFHARMRLGRLRRPLQHGGLLPISTLRRARSCKAMQMHDVLLSSCKHHGEGARKHVLCVSFYGRCVHVNATCLSHIRSWRLGTR